MKRLLIAFSILGVIFIFLGARRAYTNITQPPVEVTGAPDEGTCMDCHTGTTGSGSVSISFNGPGDKFVPGSTYEFTVHVSDPTNNRCGFSAIALDQLDSMAGSFTIINFGTTTLQANSTFTKQYIGHANATTTNSWTFQWTAPASVAGITKVTLYAAGLAGNGNSNEDGDFTYLATHDVFPSGVGIDEQGTQAQEVWEANGQLFISLVPETDAPGSYTVYDLGGRMVKSGSIPQHTSLTSVDVSDIPDGIYVVRINDTEHSSALKFRK